MAAGFITVSYIGAAILFILSLAGLSQQETARRGNIFGFTGMVIAIIATILSALQSGNFAILFPAMIVGALDRRVRRIASRDDADAAIGGHPAQLRRACRRAGRV